MVAQIVKNLPLVWKTWVQSLVGKTPWVQSLVGKIPWVQSLVGKIPWRRTWQATPVFLPGEPHGQRSLAAYSPWGHKESDMTNHSTSWASLVVQMAKESPAVWETWIWSLGWEDPLEKGMAAHSSILAWRIPWTEEPGRLQSTGSQSWTQLSNFHFPRGIKIKSRSCNIFTAVKPENR